MRHVRVSEMLRKHPAVFIPMARGWPVYHTMRNVFDTLPGNLRIQEVLYFTGETVAYG